MGPVAQFLLLSLSVALSYATPAHNYPFYLSTGNSQQYRSQDPTGNYEFGYDEGHSSGGTFRKESGDAFGNKYGSYGLRDADGRYRVVNYVADEHGFRASVQTNEPGVSPDDPASTTINKVLVPVVKQQEPVAVFTKTAPAVVKQEQVSVFTKTVPHPPVVKQEPVSVFTPVVKQEPISVFTKTGPAVVKQEPVSVFTPIVKQEPISIFTKPVGKSVPAPVSKGSAFPTATNNLFYAPTLHHSGSPDYPLLYQAPYQAPYQVPYQAPYGYYKGTPYVGYNTYKGTPYAGRYGYYVYP